MKSNKPKQYKALTGFGVRADDEKVRLIRSLGIDTGDLFRRAIDAELFRLKGECPTCGHKRNCK